MTIEERVASLVHNSIQELTAYKVFDAGDMIKLDAMESPYGFNAELKDRWLERLAATDVNRYPDSQARALKAGLREVFEIPDAVQLMLGNGSDELLQLIQLVVAGAGRCVMSPVPSFAMYEIIARYTRAEFVSVSLDENFGLNAETWLNAVTSHQPACIFFAFPNNPTGNLFDVDLIAETARIAKGIVVVDEAYYRHCGQSMMSCLSEHDNMLVLRTLSKSGFAGLRLGFLVGTAEWINEFEKLRPPYNVGVLTNASVVFALEHWRVIDVQNEVTLAERQRMLGELQAIDAIKAYPSRANFITVRSLTTAGEAVYRKLIDHGILVKNLHGYHPVLENCLRFTIGRPDENDALLAALRQILAE